MGASGRERWLSRAQRVLAGSERGLRVLLEVLFWALPRLGRRDPSEQKCVNTPARALSVRIATRAPLHRRLRRVSRAGENRRPDARSDRADLFNMVRNGAAPRPRPAPPARPLTASPRPRAAAQAGREGARRALALDRARAPRAAPALTPPLRPRRAQRTFSQRSERVKGIDIHPTEPWCAAVSAPDHPPAAALALLLWCSLITPSPPPLQDRRLPLLGPRPHLELCGAGARSRPPPPDARRRRSFADQFNPLLISCIPYNLLPTATRHLTHPPPRNPTTPPPPPQQTLVKSFELTDLPVRTAKFVARKQWVVAGADDMAVRVYNYNTMDKVKQFEAHGDYIRHVAAHPTAPLLLTCSDDMLIKLWDWERGWACAQVFEGHSHYVMQVGGCLFVCGVGGMFGRVLGVGPDLEAAALILFGRALNCYALHSSRKPALNPRSKPSATLPAPAHPRRARSPSTRATRTPLPRPRSTARSRSGRSARPCPTSRSRGTSAGSTRSPTRPAATGHISSRAPTTGSSRCAGGRDFFIYFLVWCGGWVGGWVGGCGWVGWCVCVWGGGGVWNPPAWGLERAPSPPS
jgi:hypothetical protein